MCERGRFIVLEGGDAAGKTTQARLLAQRMGAVLTREPGGTPLGEAVRSLLLDGTTGLVGARAELLLMLAARVQHVSDVIEPALSAGLDVVCDRFEGSTIAYQGYGRGLPVEEVASWCAMAAGAVRPDVTVLIDVAPQTAAARRSGRDDRIEAEGADFQARVRAGYLELARLGRWQVVDGAAPPDVVAADIDAAIAAARRETPPRGETPWPR
jgi:dTMP kinase